MNNYKKSLIAQSVLLLLSCILVIIYTKNQMMNGFSSKSKKIYAVTTSIALISLVYLIYYIGNYADDATDTHTKLNQIIISCYIFFLTLFCFIFIYNSKSKHKRVSILNRIILYLAAASTIILFINLVIDKPYDDNQKIAIIASSMLMGQAVIGDAIIWPKYFKKN